METLQIAVWIAMLEHVQLLWKRWYSGWYMTPLFGPLSCYTPYLLCGCETQFIGRHVFNYIPAVIVPVRLSVPLWFLCDIGLLTAAFVQLPQEKTLIVSHSLIPHQWSCFSGLDCKWSTDCFHLRTQSNSVPSAAAIWYVLPFFLLVHVGALHIQNNGCCLSSCCGNTRMASKPQTPAPDWFLLAIWLWFRPIHLLLIDDAKWTRVPLRNLSWIPVLSEPPELTETAAVRSCAAVVGLNTLPELPENIYCSGS